jgi:hypothetical protein
MNLELNPRRENWPYAEAEPLESTLESRMRHLFREISGGGHV